MVDSVTFSPDGKLLVSAASEHVRLWDIATGEPRGILDSPEFSPLDRLSRVAFRPDGKALATGALRLDYQNPEIAIWDPAIGELIKQMREQHELVREDPLTYSSDDFVQDLAYSLDGETLTLCSVFVITRTNHARRFGLVEGAQGAVVLIRVWNPASGELKREFPIWVPGYFWDEIVDRRVFLSPDNKHIAFRCRSSIGVADMYKDGHFLWENFISEEKWTRLVFSLDGKILACQYLGTSEIQLCDAITGQLIRSLNFATGNTQQEFFAFSSDQKYFACTTSMAKSIYIWDLSASDDVACKVLEDMGLGYISSLAFSPDSKVLATGSDNQFEVHLWNLADAKPSCDHPSKRNPNFQRIIALAVSTAAGLIATVNKDNIFQLWGLYTAELFFELKLKLAEVKPHQIQRIFFSPDGQFVAVFNGYSRTWKLFSHDDDLKLLLLEIAVRRALERYNLDVSGWLDVWSLGFSPDGRYIAARGTIRSSFRDFQD